MTIRPTFSPSTAMSKKTLGFPISATAVHWVKSLHTKYSLQFQPNLYYAFSKRWRKADGSESEPRACWWLKNRPIRKKSSRGRSGSALNRSSDHTEGVSGLQNPALHLRRPFWLKRNSSVHHCLDVLGFM